MSEAAKETPLPDLYRQAGAFITEHAYHALTFDDAHGRVGVFATCRTCCHSINYPFEPLPEPPGEANERSAVCPKCGYIDECGKACRCQCHEPPEGET